MAVDPVCSMDVNEVTAQWKSEYQGQIYYFCGAGCKRAFDRQPEKYSMASGTDHGPGHHHGHLDHPAG